MIDIAPRIPVDSAGRVLAASEGAEGTDSILDTGTWEDLAFLPKPKKDISAVEVMIAQSAVQKSDSLASAINRTETILGRIFLFGRFTRPVNDIALLTKRQNAIKALLNPDMDELFKNLKKGMAILQKHETHLLSFWNSRMALPGRVDNRFFRYGFAGFDSWANTNSLAITINSTVEVAKSITSIGLQAVAAVAMPAYAISTTGIFSSETDTRLNSYASRFAGASGPLYSLAALSDNPVAKVGTGVSAGVMAGLFFTTSCKWLKADITTEEMLHTKMLSVAQYYRKMKTIYAQLKDEPSVTANLEHFANLKTFFNHPKLQGLFAALESRTFNSEAGIFFQRGNVLFPWRFLEEQWVKGEFNKALVAIAEIDALVSNVVLLKETNNQNGAKYSFPEYLTNKKTPYIALEDYWHPVVGSAAVVNSITLGENDVGPLPVVMGAAGVAVAQARPEGMQNIVVTGPNAGGKSTALRSITSSIALGMSLGFVPAKKMTFTLFDRVISSMQTSDSIQAGESLFQKQIRFADELTTEISASPNKLFFTALDELFNGTNALDGASFAMGTAKVLSRYPNSITMFATHFKEVTALEGEEDTRVANMKVSVDATGNSDYKLTKGISNQTVAFQVATKIMGAASPIVQEAALVKRKLAITKINY